jgi:hypothetical protein
MASHVKVKLCTKKAFNTKRGALAAKDKINNSPFKGQKADIQGVYKCDICKEWHLTSLSKKHAKAIQVRKDFRETSGEVSKEGIEKRMEFLKNVYKIRHKFNK